MKTIKKIASHTIKLTDRVLGISQVPLTVLCYHSISHQNTEVDISPRQFKAQLKYLKEHTQVVQLTKLLNSNHKSCLDSRPKVAITFDDGYENVFHTAYPIMHELKLTGTIFILSRPEKANRRELNNRKKLMAPSQIKQLSKAGWEIGCHTATHADLTQPSTDLYTEIIKSRSEIETKYHCKANHFAYPKGKWNQDIYQYAKNAGYQACFTTIPSPDLKEQDPLLLPRVSIDRSHSMEGFKLLFSTSVRTLLSLRETALYSQIYKAPKPRFNYAV